ncbi:DUF3955 domain-containing protein [Aeromonas sp. FDAARGOS 1407]|uniref:DUF3955 domain-containing protein n=1 Tax=Aeromonas TaxID=642 RepID=UPI001C22CFC7|nr:DUF3955 domain-containing protein [Aeromonas sp. FDAARGOS 1407]QXC33471.1 DUF3955 domain-containing protein [Aeromonas sp. FDAARGOS 1407]
MTRFGILLILAGLCCFLAFHQIGATLDTQGVLHEPFALIPLGYLLLFAGAVLALVPLHSVLRRRAAKGE